MKEGRKCILMIFQGEAFFSVVKYDRMCIENSLNLILSD